MTVQVARSSILAELETRGIAILPELVTGETLRRMQRAFGTVLGQQRWNDVNGYEKTEPFRHMVQDVLLLDQGFLDLALHPIVVDTLREYVGEGFQLVEAKGWESIPTSRDFHGWHGDAWYDQTKVTDTIPREVKLALYLTDVTSGHFEYVSGSHRKQAPRPVADAELTTVAASEIVQAKAKAGSVILFDTSGVHRQSVPILATRWAVFYNYHDPSVPLQPEDIAYDRYHPLILNAAFLGSLDPERQRILGFGDQRNYIHAFRRRTRHRRFHALLQRSHDLNLRVDDLSSRVSARLKRIMGRSR